VGEATDAATAFCPTKRTQFFVSRTTFDSCQRVFTTACDKGTITVTLGGLAVDRHTWKKAVGAARSQFAAAAPANQPCSPVVLERARRTIRDFVAGHDIEVCGPFKDLDSCCAVPPPAPPATEDWIGKGATGTELVFLPTDISYRIEHRNGFEGQFAPAPYDAVFWKGLLMVTSAVVSAGVSAAVSAELAALGDAAAIGTVKRAVLNALAAAPATPPAATADGSVDAAVVALDKSRGLPGVLFSLLDAAADEPNAVSVSSLGGRIDLSGVIVGNTELSAILAAAATDPEGLQVFKSGATTGVTRGVLQALVPVTARASGGKVSYFLNQLTIAPDPAAPAANGEIVAAGDSGALWVHWRTGRIVALQHASVGGLAVATRIGDVMKALNIRFA
jgi:hypothetical protein